MDTFIGSVLLVPYTYIPDGWLPCVGALLPIQDYEPLFNLIGTTYGGNGQDTFALPNLQNICPTGMMYIISYLGIYPSSS
jgi:microcystin-dependent protein